MNHYVPDWRMEDDNSRLFHDLLPASNQKKFIGPDSELIELLWDNGHVVMHSQTNCRTLPNVVESKQTQKPESSFKCGGSLGKSSNLIQEDEPASWFQNPLDDSLDKEFSELFSSILNADHIVTDKVNRVEKFVKGSSFEDCNACPKNSSFYPQNSMMLPSKPHVSITTKHSPSLENGAVMNSSHHTKSGRSDTEPAIRSFGGVALDSETVVRMEETSSMRTISSSICGSNKVQNQVEVSHCTSNDREVKEDSLLGSAHNHRQATTFDPTVASLSGGSGCSFGRTGQQSMTNHSHKRKGRDAYDSEVHSEETEYESVEANKHAQKSAPSRRSRAAEVHNLSERRRRDRINEKMRALQELIPHCNKSDKASMLDEAIGYLKSLQLQVQIMWMGSGIAPMMFPGVQPYMSRMGIGIGQPPLPSIPNTVQFPRATVINQSMPSIYTTNPPLACPPGISPFYFSNHMANIHRREPFSHYLDFPQIQLPPQMRDFYTYGSQIMQQNQTVAPSVDGKCIPAVEAPSRNMQNGQGG